MNWLKRMLVNFLLKYIAEYARKGVKEMADTSSKKGIKSSEMWVGLIGVILTYLNSQLELNMPVSSIVSIAGIVISYIASRTWLKSKGQDR